MAMRRFWVGLALVMFWGVHPTAAEPIVGYAHFGVPSVPKHKAPPAHAPTSPSVSLPGQNASTSHHHHQYANNGGWFMWSGGYPVIWTGGYTSAFPYYPAAYAYPPTYVPVPAPLAPARIIPDPAQFDPALQPAPKTKAKVTNAETKAKAGRFLAYGDANFGKQKYLPAAERYKTATEIAPDIAESYLRQGFALVAIGQYESAAKAFRRGLKVRSNWSDSGFRLDQIYGADRLAKTAHLENLAKAVEANPLDSELLVTLGVQLYFDGQRDRAGVFLGRASQLGGNEDRLLNNLLPKPAPKEPVGEKVVF